MPDKRTRDRGGKFNESAGLPERQLEALRLRREGKQYREIAEALGVGESQAFRDVKAVLDRTKELANEEARELRKLECERMDVALNAIMPKVKAGNTAAIETMIRLQKRRADLLGLDPPKRLEASGPDGAPIAIDARSDLIDRLTSLVASETTSDGEG